ncbi:CXADR-like membrane protein [Protopterus annectens]|uniref:CXADR-like membrane protein n=1 Tax=Protopterus annectens TaxID=7888 RepID=UPI001CFB8F57|nr:CXADR-like membrane protein [Protopterus annectens]
MIMDCRNAIAAAFLLCNIVVTALANQIAIHVVNKTGECAILPCKYNKPKTDSHHGLDIEWEFKGKVIITLSGWAVYFYQHDFKDRLAFLYDNGSNEDASLLITSLKVNDSGTYNCKVKQGPNLTQSTVNLTVIPETNSSSENAIISDGYTNVNTRKTNSSSENASISDGHTNVNTRNQTNLLKAILIPLIILLIILVPAIYIWHRKKNASAKKRYFSYPKRITQTKDKVSNYLVCLISFLFLSK